MVEIKSFLKKLKQAFQRKLKIRLLLMLSVIFLITGIITSKQSENALLNAIEKRICVDSKEHSSFQSWVGDNMNDFTETREIRAYYWNIINKDEFLYNGATPQVQERGPYVYSFVREKVAYEFDQKKQTVRYKTRMLTKFNQTKTQTLCYGCSENDRINVLNLGYLGMLNLFTSEKDFVLSKVPAIFLPLLNIANQITNNENSTYAKLGLVGGYIFPPEFYLLPTNWRPGFGNWFAQMTKSPHPTFRNATPTNFTTVQMKSLYKMIVNESLLGTNLPSYCSINMTEPTCLSGGFLHLMKVHKVNNDVNVTKIIKSNLKKILCPDEIKQCIEFDEQFLDILHLYISDHVVKFVIHFLIDSKNIGLVTSRTVSELSHGYTMSVGPVSKRIQGFVSTDGADENYSEYWLCGNDRGITPSSLHSINGSTEVPQHYFPNASETFRKIDGMLTINYIGRVKSLTACKSPQPEQHSVDVFDPTYSVAYKLKYTGDGDYKGKQVHKYMVDFNSLYAVNNISVFQRGLFDATNLRDGIPFIYSQPHFYGTDKQLITRLNMRPIENHQSVYEVEPIVGSPIVVDSKLQINAVILDKYISAPRARAYNITYKHSDGERVLNKPVPIFWFNVKAIPSADNMVDIKKITITLNISCGALVLGPLLSIMFLTIAVFVLVKIFKRIDIINEAAKESPVKMEDL